jgi:ABC-type transport system involved in cytochrome c biogenesis permease component
LLPIAPHHKKGGYKEALFSVLFFPLSVPPLLCTYEASLAFSSINSQNVVSNYIAGWSWVGLLSGFSIIFATLGLLLFPLLCEKDEV